MALIKRPHRSSVSPGNRATSTARRFTEVIAEWKVAIVVGMSITGIFFLVLALSLPEWFIIINNNVRGHVGFFSRCVYGPGPDDVNCYDEIIQETAAVVSMFLASLTSAIIAIAIGVHRTVLRLPFNEDLNIRAFYRMRIMVALSGLSNLTGMGTCTYLYHDFLSPPAASYSLGWVSTMIMLTAGGIGFFFDSSVNMKTNTAESNVAHDTTAETTVAWATEVKNVETNLDQTEKDICTLTDTEPNTIVETSSSHNGTNLQQE